VSARSIRARRWVVMLAFGAVAVVLLATGRLILGGIVAALVVLRVAIRQHRRARVARLETAATTGLSTIDIDGTPRRYVLHRPDGVGDGPRPLVIVLHGAGGTAPWVRASLGWDSLADIHGFNVLYPDGVDRSWNAGTCCGTAAQGGIDDVAFVDILVNATAHTGIVDPERVYVTGISNGGMMAYRLACELPGRFAAIGPVAATMTVACSDATPTSVCHVHGLRDDIVRFGGGVAASGTARDVRPPVPATIAAWRAVDRCGEVRVEQDGPVRTETADGPGGATVTLVTIADAGHLWPGRDDPRSRLARWLRLDPPGTAVDATAILWRFFATHPRPHTPATAGKGDA